MDSLTFTGVCLIAFAAYCAARFHGHGTIAAASERSLTLRNGDRIRCFTAAEVMAGAAHCILPGVTDKATAIRTRMGGIMQAAMSRWALQFGCAADARTEAAYDSLRRAVIGRLLDGGLDVQSADVTGIEVEAYAPKPEKSTEEDAPISPVEAIRKKHSLVVEELEAIQRSEAEIAERHPDIVSDPDIWERLAAMFDGDKSEAITREEPLGFQKRGKRSKHRGY